MIVFSSDQAVKDTFDKKSSIYSSRPEVYIARTVGGSHKVDGGYRVLNMVSKISLLTADTPTNMSFLAIW